MGSSIPLTKLISLEGKRALITGAGAGIGRAIALRFAEAGADLVLVDRDNRTLSITAKLLTDYQVQVQTHSFDITDREARSALWRGFGAATPDILVNNAGIYPFSNSLDLDENLYRQVMAVNMDSVYWMCQAFIKLREGDGGIIINLSSIEALLPFKKDLAHYSASKAAVLALTRALAREHGADNFRANVIIPGGIKTPGTRAAAFGVLKFRFDLIGTAIRFRNRLPLRRLGQADEVARVALFLASDLASYVQGAAVPVDGGFLSA